MCLLATKTKFCRFQPNRHILTILTHSVPRDTYGIVEHPQCYLTSFASFNVSSLGYVWFLHKSSKDLVIISASVLYIGIDDPWCIVTLHDYLEVYMEVHSVFNLACMCNHDSTLN